MTGDGTAENVFASDEIAVLLCMLCAELSRAVQCYAVPDCAMCCRAYCGIFVFVFQFVFVLLLHIVRAIYVYSFVRLSCALMEFRVNVRKLFHLFDK